MAIESLGRPITDTGAETPGVSRTKRQYFPELQGIRAIAVLLMITIHTSIAAGLLAMPGGPDPSGWAILVERFARESLPLFFGLSGVLIFRPFALHVIGGAKKPNLKSYTWRRILRIFPGFWVMAIIVMSTIAAGQITGAWQVIKVLLMQHVYGLGDMPNGMQQTWSMSTETAYYVLVPLLAWLSLRIARNAPDPVSKARRMLIPLGLLVVLSYLWAGYAHSSVFGPWAVQGNWPLGWFGFLGIGMIFAVLSSAAEVAPHRVFAPYRIAPRHPLLCWAAAFVLTLLYCFSPAGGQGTAIYPSTGTMLANLPVDFLIVSLIMAPLTVPQERPKFIKAVLTNKPLEFLGKISYGMYLWHIAVIWWVYGSLVGQHNWFSTMVVVIGGSIILGTLSYYIVERPALQLRNKLGKTSVAPGVEVVAK
jgi:peptidoglycan/LPS O-acetylase OafA/YrhL